MKKLLKILIVMTVLLTSKVYPIEFTKAGDAILEQDAFNYDPEGNFENYYRLTPNSYGIDTHGAIIQ